MLCALTAREGRGVTFGLRNVVHYLQTKMISNSTVLLSLTLAATSLAPAAIIGTNQPAQPLTIERVSRLPEKLRPAWRAYLEISTNQAQADRDFFIRDAKERHGTKESLPPPPDKERKRLPLNQPAAWYGGPEGRRIADIVISFQTPAGGWSKNLDMTTHRRAPGEPFNGHTASDHLGPADFDSYQNLNWSYVGTFDNSATTTQLRFLASVISATEPEHDSAPRRAFLRGIDYILAAQFPNGGWPQVWPLEGGYHDAITYNDGAMTKVLQLLREVAEGRNDFHFVPDKARALAEAALARGIECILQTQIVAHGKRTVWCQQYDALTLQPTSARNYEMPAQAAGESVGVMSFLMQLPHPNTKTAAAIRAAAAWFEKNKLHDVTYKAVGEEGKLLVPSPGAPPLWARYYEIGSDRPVFGDRDKSIHDTVKEISKERRNGYGWFTEGPRRALEQFASWSAAHSQ
jgi:PelA/Pel-15E family pectate lyase